MLGDHGAVGAGTRCPRTDTRRQSLDTSGGSEHHPLVVELRGDQSPPATLVADAHRYRIANIVVVRGIHVMSAVGGDDRRPTESRIGGVDDEDRDALVLGGVLVGADRQPDVVGVVPAGGEDLLPVDHVVITVADRRRGQ